MKFSQKELKSRQTKMGHNSVNSYQSGSPEFKMVPHPPGLPGTVFSDSVPSKLSSNIKFTDIVSPFPEYKTDQHVGWWDLTLLNSNTPGTRVGPRSGTENLL